MIEGIDIHSQIYEKSIFFILSLFIGFLFLRFGWRKGFFHLPAEISLIPLRGRDVFSVFGLFLFAQLILAPAIVLFFLSDVKYDLLSGITKSWIQLGSLFLGFISLLVSFFLIPKSTRKAIWNSSDQPWYWHILFGFSILALVYPLILAINQGVSILVWLFWGHYTIDQLAVEQVKKSFSEPFLFAVTFLLTVTIVPLCEEFLFRGVLQSWMKKRWNSRYGAIFFSSLIFAFFHFSGKQGILNIELLISLFCVSCAIGFTYEKQKSLLAPIAFHSLFNFISILFLYMEKS